MLCNRSCFLTEESKQKQTVSGPHRPTVFFFLLLYPFKILITLTCLTCPKNPYICLSVLVMVVWRKTKAASFRRDVQLPVRTRMFWLWLCLIRLPLTPPAPVTSERVPALQSRQHWWGEQQLRSRTRRKRKSYTFMLCLHHHEYTFTCRAPGAATS